MQLFKTHRRGRQPRPSQQSNERVHPDVPREVETRRGLNSLDRGPLVPAKNTRADNERDREYRENEDSDENVDGLNKLKHG
jgi:hypothetical protein